MRQLRIGNRVLTDDDVFVIAEIGANHMGDFDLCCLMIEVAAKCGVDAVKLQKRDNDAMFTKAALNKPYNNDLSYGKTYGEHRKYLDGFGREEFASFIRIANYNKVLLFATPFEENSAEFLHDLGMPLWKIASCDVTNLPLCRKIAGYGQPMIISTGGATFDEISRLCREIEPINDNFALLHCISTYPNSDNTLNLEVIRTLKAKYPDKLIGFSSHHPGIEPLVVARTIGASIFEVHFTLNRGSRGTDHGFSMEPQGLQKLCSDLKRVNIMLGNGEKKVLPQEKSGFITKMGKSIHVARPIKAGKAIEPDDICIKSPAEGLPPYEYDNVVGRITLFDLSTESGLERGDLL